MHDDPICIPQNAKRKKEKQLLMEFEKSLNHITAKVDNHFNHYIQ